MSTTVKCDGYGDVGSYYCEAAGKDISESWFAKYCSKDYKEAGGEGYGTCIYFKKYVECHIVTAICDTLKEPKYRKASEKFKRKLIDSGKYQEQLAIYDAIGPVIANRIRGNERVCKILFERTVKPVCKLIEAGQDEMALKQFSDMVVQFIEPECRTNQESVKPNGVFTELMQYDPKTIRDCEQAATTHFCTYQLDKYNQIQKRLGSIAI